jgi:hypothetical protein
LVAFTIPETIPARSSLVTSGERKVFVALRDHLPEDYVVYYDIPVGGRHPDFIALGPDLGLIVLEVKDWRLGSIAGAAGDRFRIRHREGETLVENPIRQAREYTLRAVDLLKRRKLLQDGDGVRCPWGYGVVLPFLSAADVRAPSLFGPSLEEALEPGRVLTADDLTATALQPALRRLLPDWTRKIGPLSPAHVDEMRGALYPEIRIGWDQSDTDILRVMDLEQDRLARTLGDGHRLLRGVAGSGKTVALICRARHLRERHPDWRILVVCYNKALAAFLNRAIEPDARLEVATFHKWCRDQLKAAGVQAPRPPGRGKERQDYWEQQLPALLPDAFGQRRIASGAYQAVLVDEGQDFADTWYQSLLRALDPATNSLFVALDSSQNIYRRQVSWRQVGLQFAGRTRVLRRNYRNTRPILSLAYRVIQRLDAAAPVAPDSLEEYVAPERALRNGVVPQLVRCRSAEDSRSHALAWVRERLDRGVSPGEILVLDPIKPSTQELARWLRQQGVRVTGPGQGGGSDGIRLSTIHGAKGLDAQHVLLVNAHRLTEREDAEARRLLYIAMTRARDELCIVHLGDWVLASELEQGIIPASPQRPKSIRVSL